MSDASKRAARAQQLLDDPLLQESLSTLETETVDALVSATFHDTNELISLVAELKAARRVTERLNSVLLTGKAEERKPFAAA